jgi:hypothetical protein
MPVTIDSIPARGGFKPNSAPEGFEFERDQPAGFADFYLPLHRQFTRLPIVASYLHICRLQR